MEPDQREVDAAPGRARGRRPRQPRARHARVLRVLPGALLAALAVGLAGAPPAGAADLVDLALRWARGDYRAPLLCQFGEQPRRGLRRVRIAPASRRALRRADRVQFFDLDAPDATRCFSELGREEPNVVGTLEITLQAPSRPDTALHDFKNALRREGGFEYRIESGRLRIGAPATPKAELREVDFAGGTARLVAIEPGSDAARLLAEFGARRKLRLELTARDETRLVLELVELASR